MPYTQTVSSGYLTPLSGAPAVMYSYNALGRQTLQTSPDGSTQQTVYNDIQLNGWRVVRSVDAKGNSQVAYVDGLGRVQKIIPPTQGGSAMHPMVEYTYDALDRLSTVLRGGATTTLTYDLGGRKVKLIDPDMGTWNYTYDAVSNLKTQKDARLCETSMTYDKLERMLTKSFSGGITCNGNTVTMIYDQGANGIGRRTVMHDSSTYSISYTYDAHGRLIHESRSLDSIGVFASAWSYNSADLIATMRYPEGNNGQLGETVAYEYTQRMLASSAEGDYTYLNSASYDAAGRLTQRVLGTNQAQSQYTYYPWTSHGGRLQQITAGTLGNPLALLQLQYGYDLNGKILSIQDYKMGNPQTQSFSYDNLNRLLTASASGGNGGIGDYSQSYTYNPTTGNLETKAGAVYTYGNSQHPHAVMAVTGGGAFTYDANGNMETKTYPSLTTYTYNGDNRLASVSGSASASFLYDGDGQRMAATINGVTTVYIGEYFEWQPATGQTSKYYFAGGQRIAMRVIPQGQNAAPLWLFGDHLGSTSVVANTDGSQHSRQGYKAWGESRFSIGSLPTKNQYTGQISHEAELGLYFYKARYYNPALSRWLQPDTLVPDPANPLDWDRYQYVMSRPVNYLDPMGFCGVDPYDPYYDYECHRLAQEISKAESQGSPDNEDALYDFYDSANYSSLLNYYNEAVKPYLDVQQFTVLQAKRVKAGEIDDVQALQNILEFALLRANGDLALALTYASSAFYRDEVGRFGSAKNYSYTFLTQGKFGTTGFNNFFVGDPTNSNQLEHLIGESHIMMKFGGSRFLSNLMATIFDHENTPESTADRNLGYVAAWWISQATSVNIDYLVQILRDGRVP